MRRAFQASIVLACLSFASDLFARPGGGHTFSSHSYSSHSGGYGGGHGDGGGELIFLLIRLVFFYPWLSLPVLALVVLYWMRANRSSAESWDTSRAEPPAAVSGGAVDLASLRALDPEYSRVVFEDFAYRLYASAQRARHDESALAALAPYLSDRVRAELAAESAGTGAVLQVVVGSLRIVRSSFREASGDRPATVQLALDYISNVTSGSRAQSQTFYLHEVWSLERDAGARTKSPEETERLGCPNCGAPFESSDGRRCNYCGQVVADGRFAWQVVAREVLERAPEPPALTSDVEERGTDFPSVVDPDDEAAWRSLRARDPAVDDAGLRARTARIYDELNRAWTALDLDPVRGFVSDAMFDYLRYWTEAYVAQGLRNRLERMSIARIERVKVVLDHHFSAVTLRIWASGLDYTVAADSGALVSGSNSRPREYSEYWTLIRAAAARGAARADATCPSCGAPLQINMAGNCEHCASHITRGEFDWVLSKIEQDDVYAG